MSRLIKTVVSTVVAVLMVACGGGGGGSAPAATTAPPPPPPPPPAPKQFIDATASSGISFEVGNNDSFGVGSLDRTVEDASTGGVASGDYDGDGDVDLFITRGDAGPNLLYRNDGNLVFMDVAATAGVAWTKSATENYRLSGPIFGDVDGDGDLDLFVGGLYGDPSLLFENNGDGTFTDVTLGSGIDTLGAKNNISAAFGDYDLDGDIDLLVAHWGTPRGTQQTLPDDTETLWRNDTDATGILFTNVSQSTGISPSILTLDDPRRQPTGNTRHDWSWALSFARINDDVYPDIVVAADFNESQVFLNNQAGIFTNATDVDVIIDEHGMGSALGDYDNDGDLDWFVTSILTGDDLAAGQTPRIGNRLYRNDDGAFVDVTDQANVADGGWGWGTCFIDFENDGDLDIYHTNGWSLPDGLGSFPDDRSRAFVGNGTDAFEERAADLGLDDSQDGRGVVCADFDEDGDVDILLLHRGAPVSATLWRNDTVGNNYLRVKLNGLPPNTEASGARITVTIGGEQQMREIILGNNFVSQNPAVQVFGLGPASQVDDLRVEWPGIGGPGPVTMHGPYNAGQTVVIDHPSL